MKLVLPEYYKKFKCIAEKCTDNCCKSGWEIDIDDTHSNIYKNTKGIFGDILRENITTTTPPHFKLNKNHTCPFLNEKNLCDIILTLGEENLCQICTEHPRYYEWFDGIKEGGIGLCCEEAARIILQENTNFKTYQIEINNEDCDEYNKILYNYLSSARIKIIEYLNNSTQTLSAKIKNILWYAYTLQQNINCEFYDDEDIIDVQNIDYYNPNSILEFLTNNMEVFNPTWKTKLHKLIDFNINNSHIFSTFVDNNVEISNYLKNICIYFVWRYFLKSVYDEDAFSKIGLMAVSVLIIENLIYRAYMQNSTIDLNIIIKAVTEYSQEIEYCNENVFKIYDSCYDNFTVENLMGSFL